MSDKNWLSLDNAEAMFFASADEILLLVKNGAIEARQVAEGDHSYIRVLEIHMDRNFHRRDPAKAIRTSRNEIVVGSVAGICAASIYDVGKAVVKTFNSTDGTGGNTTIDKKYTERPINFFPRSYFLEHVIERISLESNLQIRKEIFKLLKRSLDFQELETTALSLDIYANTALSKTVLINYKVLISGTDIEAFLTSFGWDILPIGFPTLRKRILYVGIIHNGIEYFSYVEWLASFGMQVSQDTQERLDYHSTLIEHFQKNSR